MNFEYGPADQEALERRNALAQAAVQAEQRNVDVLRWRLEERPAKPTMAKPLKSRTMKCRRSRRVVELTIHGEFTDDAAASQSIKAAIRAGRNWQGLSDIQMEALKLIATKIARILSGDPNHPDHWADIEGQARLAHEQL